jgi:hypothetical protein
VGHGDRDEPRSGRFPLARAPGAAGAAARHRLFDYFENEGIAAMLAAGPQAGDDLIERTSLWTRAKSLAGLASELREPGRHRIHALPASPSSPAPLGHRSRGSGLRSTDVFDPLLGLGFRFRARLRR